MRVGQHDYTFAEKNYGGLNRGVTIIINHIGVRNNRACYRLGRAYNPHDLDVNWYLRGQNWERFYTELGTAVARRLENGNQNWNSDINWPRAIHANIHNVGYHAIRDDLY